MKKEVKKEKKVTSANPKTAAAAKPKTTSTKEKSTSKKSAPVSKAVTPQASSPPASVPTKLVPPAPMRTQQHTPSIASAKEALFQQRMSQVKTPEVKRPVQSAPSVFQAPRRPMPLPVVPPKPKLPIVEAKSFVRPAEPISPSASAVAPEPARARKAEIAAPITVKDLALKFGVRPSDLIGRLIKMSVFASINQSVNFDIAAKVGVEFGFELSEIKVESQVETPAARTSGTSAAVVDKSKLVPRAPVVTFMGHVDHGKTSLLDAIRKTKVAAGEAGGITQHIGAYEVFLPKGAVTFLDTPGHEAFTQMRARGAHATDVVVLVVAADDGVMPQTIEAIDHAKAANVPIIVAINKIDLSSAQPDRVKKGLMEHGIMSEDWGGKTLMLNVSAKTGQGIDELLEMLVLESDLLELKADPTAAASGVVIEAELSKDSGVLATMLVQDGTLRVGDFVIVGDQYGKVRAMINDRGARVREALPSMPVEVLGLNAAPKAGDQFYVVKDEHAARAVVEGKQADVRQGKLAQAAHTTLEHLLEDVKAGKVEELKLILKSDVQGSVEALRNTLAGIKSKNVRLNIIHTGVGEISESDVLLAAASNAVVIGFHVDMTHGARAASELEQVDVRFYQIIYEVKTAIEKSMEGLLEPEEKEVFIGVAEVRQVFKVSKTGTIAGCSVQKGKIVRNFQCRVLRDGKIVHQGKVESLKRFKDDAREVLEGFECGIGVSNFDEIAPGDRVEVFEIQKKARKLE